MVPKGANDSEVRGTVGIDIMGEGDGAAMRVMCGY